MKGVNGHKNDNSNKTITDGDKVAISGDKTAADGDKVAIKNLDDRQLMIYQFIIENGSVNNSQVRQLLSIKKSAALNILKSMESVIEPTGKNRSTKYVLRKH